MIIEDSNRVTNVPLQSRRFEAKCHPINGGSLSVAIRHIAGGGNPPKVRDFIPRSLRILATGILLAFGLRTDVRAQVLFFDNFEQFAFETDITATNYYPTAGPPGASVVTSVQNGSPTIKITSLYGSKWAIFDNSKVTNKNQYKGSFPKIQTNQTLGITWKMWLERTNSGLGMFSLSIPVNDANPSVTFNPPLAFLDTGAIIAITNGSSPFLLIGSWGSFAGTFITNELAGY